MREARRNKIIKSWKKKQPWSNGSLNNLHELYSTLKTGLWVFASNFVATSWTDGLTLVWFCIRIGSQRGESNLYVVHFVLPFYLQLAPSFCCRIFLFNYVSLLKRKQIEKNSRTHIGKFARVSTEACFIDIILHWCSLTRVFFLFFFFV